MAHVMRSSGGLRRGAGAAMILGTLALAAAVSVVFPALMAVAAVAAGFARDGAAAAFKAAAIDASGAVLLLRTVRTALLIGVLSTSMAWPVAWALRARRGAWVGLMLAPLLMPSYLAYAGWGLLRAPGTWSGDFIAAAQPPPWSTEPGYWPLLSGAVLAVMGLALWAWPLAVVVLAAGASRIDESILEALRLEAGVPWRRCLCVLGMMRASLVAAVFAVALVMLGSAVPLQVAQMETWAVHIWLLLDETSAQNHWAIWLAAWPLVVVAIVTAVGLSSRLTEAEQGGQAASSQPGRLPRVSRPISALAGIVWSASVLGPAALFAWFIPNWRALETFWRVHHEPVLNSLGIGAGMAVAGAGIAAAAWFGLSSGRFARRIVAACMVVFLIGGLVPGVLVGSATAAAWNAWPLTRWMGDSPAIVVLGHIARFGFAPLLIGAFLARSEPIEQRDSRGLDGADNLSGWSRACLPTGLGTVVAAGLAAGILSFHEIEAAVILQPPGLDSFPRQMLAFLHYARTQELCAGALLAMAVGVGGAVLAIVCDAAAGIRWRR